MTRLIIVGPVPPPFHGVTVSTALVLANAELERRFQLEHLDTSDHRPGTNIGRWDLPNIWAGLAAVVRFIRRIRGEPGLVYLPVSQGLGGLARDTLLIRIAARRGWRVAAHLRGSELGDFSRDQPAPIRKWLQRSFDRLDSIAVLGSSLGGVLDGLVSRDRIAVVCNGTPDPGGQIADYDAGTCLFLSNLRPRKGVLEALEAALIVTREDPTAQFVFAGDRGSESFRRRLDRIAADAGGRIELRDPATGEDKWRLMSRSSMLLFPPLEPEGQPRVVLEAMAAGLPVVTTDRGAIAETVGDAAGFVLPDPKPAELADRILRLLRDKTLMAEMGTAARERYLAHYTQEQADVALAEWLEEVAADSGLAGAHE